MRWRACHRWVGQEAGADCVIGSHVDIDAAAGGHSHRIVHRGHNYRQRRVGRVLHNAVIAKDVEILLTVDGDVDLFRKRGIDLDDESIEGDLRNGSLGRNKDIADRIDGDLGIVAESRWEWNRG